MDLINIRLQKGVTSFSLKQGSNVILDAKCTSVSASHLTFTATAGGMVADLLGNMDRIDVDFNGNYPGHIKFMEGNTINAYSDVTLGADGMPAKLIYKVLGYDTPVTIEFTTVAGFLAITKLTTQNLAEASGQYNDKGYLVHSVSYDNKGVKQSELSYTYEHDSHGNLDKTSGSVAGRHKHIYPRIHLLVTIDARADFWIASFFAMT